MQPPNYEADIQDNQFVINLHLTEVLIGYYASMYRQLIDVEDAWRMFKPLNLSKDERSLLVTFSQQEPNYDEWSDAKKIEMGFNRRLADWVTPSINMMAQLLLFHEEFLKLGPFYGGPLDCNNLWIVKPGSNARGHGIYVTNSLEDLVADEKMDAVGKDTLVQKYIETPLLLEIGQFEYKFDIRQWVLVTSVNPLTVYIFDGFYCRLCSNPFDIANFKDTSRHLTNYSVNKDNFKQGNSTLKSSVVDDVFLKDYLKANRNVDWEEEIQPRIEGIVIESLRATCKNMVQRERSFEIYGYDILFNDNLNPYLLEVNLSPACEEREDFLAKMLHDMTIGLFAILKDREISQNDRRPDPISVPKTEKMSKTAGRGDPDSSPDSPSRILSKLEPIFSNMRLGDWEEEVQYRWKSVYVENHDETIIRPGADNYFCVVGKPLNVKLEKLRDKKMKES